MSITPLSLQEAKPLWDELIKQSYPLVQPFSSFSWYSTWLAARTEWEPFLLLVNGTTIAPFIRQGDLVRFVYLYTDFQDLIGPIQGSWPLIMDYLKENGIKKMDIIHISKSSETAQFFTSYFQDQPNGEIKFSESSPFISLPSTFEAYLQMVKSKRKKYNKFQREYPDTQIITSSHPEKDMETLFELMNKNPIKQASAHPEKDMFFRGIARACQDTLNLQILYDKEIPVAAHIVFKHREQSMLYISGYDHENYPNAGTYLIISAIKQAIEEGYQIFNLLRGQEPYKYELGAVDSPLYNIIFEF